MVVYTGISGEAVVSWRLKEASGRDVKEEVEMDMSCSFKDSMRLSSVV